MAFSTRQWRRCRLGSRPPSAGRGAHCLADRTGLPGKGEGVEARAGGPRPGARANADLRGARTRTSGAGNVASAWRPRPRSPLSPGSANGEPRLPRDEGAVDSSWAARGERKDGRRGACATRSLRCRPPFFFRAARRPGKESAPSSCAEAPPGRGLRCAPAPRLPSRPHPPLSGRAAPASPAPSPPRSQSLRPRIVFALYLLTGCFPRTGVKRLRGLGPPLPRS